MLVQVAPPSTENCHCTVADGTPPDAAEEKATDAPAITTWLVGWLITVGGIAYCTTSSSTVLVVTEPALFVNTARYS
jgi:hypothetical protein